MLRRQKFLLHMFLFSSSRTQDVASLVYHLTMLGLRQVDLFQELIASTIRRPDIFLPAFKQPGQKDAIKFAHESREVLPLPIAEAA